MDTKLSWVSELKYDPIRFLRSISYTPIRYLLERDILDAVVTDANTLWYEPFAQNIFATQTSTGNWPDPKRIEHLTSSMGFEILETYRNLSLLTFLFEFKRNHPNIDKAVSYLLSFQTDAGDFQKIYGNQHSIAYTAKILELLVKLGYEESLAVHKGYQWILQYQLEDGGWISPIFLKAREKPDLEALMRQHSYQMDQVKTLDSQIGSSHVITAPILRALVTHSQYRNHPSTQKAVHFLLSRVNQPDPYPFHSEKSHWTDFSYPFLWADLLSLMDSCSLISIDPHLHVIQDVLHYFRESQNQDGSWNLFIENPDAIPFYDAWGTLLVTRIFKRFFTRNE